ncbi:MAG: hypothetical protein C0490_14860, partial [Marivirga sp.]|nr:hypothetical protein [Marivirga sp.]
VFLGSIPEPVSDAAPVSQPISDRPVLYLVCCDLSTDPKVNEALLAELDSSSLPPSAFDQRADHLIAGFKTIFSAMEFCDVVNKLMTHPFQQKSTSRISLHVGPVYINADSISQELSGDVIDMIERLHKISLPGSIYATNIVAAVLAMDYKKYSFDYVDTLASRTGRNLNIFKVKIHHAVVS